MGFLDNISNVANRATSAAGRTSRKAQLKVQLGDINRQRQDLAAQLGASLYDITRDNPEFRNGRETLYDGIADLDSRRAAIEAELSTIEDEAAAARIAATTYNCTQCGTTVHADSTFCTGCGKPLAEIVQEINERVAAIYNESSQAAQTAQAAQTVEQPGLKCSSCGAAIEEGDLFCQSCGTKLG